MSNHFMRESEGTCNAPKKKPTLRLNNHLDDGAFPLDAEKEIELHREYEAMCNGVGMNCKADMCRGGKTGLEFCPTTFI